MMIFATTNEVLKIYMRRLRKAFQIIPILFLVGCATAPEPAPKTAPPTQVINPHYSADETTQNAAWKVDVAACKLHQSKADQYQCMIVKGWPL